jgi:hypothetical protein
LAPEKYWQWRESNPGNIKEMRSAPSANRLPSFAVAFSFQPFAFQLSAFLPLLHHNNSIRSIEGEAFG